MYPNTILNNFRKIKEILKSFLKKIFQCINKVKNNKHMKILLMDSRYYDWSLITLWVIADCYFFCETLFSYAEIICIMTYINMLPGYLVYIKSFSFYYTEDIYSVITPGSYIIEIVWGIISLKHADADIYIMRFSLLNIILSLLSVMLLSIMASDSHMDNYEYLTNINLFYVLYIIELIIVTLMHFGPESTIAYHTHYGLIHVFIFMIFRLCVYNTNLSKHASIINFFLSFVFIHYIFYKPSLLVLSYVHYSIIGDIGMYYGIFNALAVAYCKYILLYTLMQCMLKLIKSKRH